jgi:hypothetical protein
VSTRINLTHVKIALPYPQGHVCPKRGCGVNLNAGLPRNLAARQAGVTPHAVSMWAQRGWYDRHGAHHTITIVGTNRHGHRLYRLADILTAERDTRHSANSRRRPAHQ